MFREALDLVPEPLEEWEASTWLFTSIGDCFYSMGAFDEAIDALANATKCPDALGNPFIHLRLGQCYFEIKNEEKAADELMRAYMGDGAAIFEDEAPKYLEFLKSRANL